MGPRRSEVGSRNERTPAGSWNLSRLAVASRWIGGYWYARRNACARLPLHRSYSQLYRSFLMEHRPLRGVPNMVVAAVEVEPIAASIPSSSVWPRSRAMVDSAPKMPSKTHSIGTTRGVTEGIKRLRTHERRLTTQDQAELDGLTNRCSCGPMSAAGGRRHGAAG